MIKKKKECKSFIQKSNVIKCKRFVNFEKIIDLYICYRICMILNFTLVRTLEAPWRKGVISKDTKKKKKIKR